MKILVTGGHVTPALAIIDKLQGQSIVFVGRKHALDSENTLSLEYKEITSRSIPFINLKAGRVTRLLSTRSVFQIIRIPLGFYRAFQIVQSEKPDVVLSFGSYLAAPVVFWSWVMKIPVYTHEQTMAPGMANKFIGFFSKKIFLSFPEAAKYFPKHKTIITGNPVRDAIFKTIKKPFPLKKTRSVVFVTGGSLGSHSINEHIKNILPELLKDFIVIHQTGDTKEYHDFETLSKIEDKHYIVRKHFLEDEIGYIYSLADMVVGRAGANTFFEMIALKKPTLFIPLPWSAHGEQQKQAMIFKQAGCGEVFSQSDSSEHLLELIRKMSGRRDDYKSNFSKLDELYEERATERILKEVLDRA